MEKNVGTYTMDFVSHHNQHKQFAPFGAGRGFAAPLFEALCDSDESAARSRPQCHCLKI